MVWQSRIGTAWRGQVGIGKAVMDSLGVTGRGAAQQGSLGLYGRGSDGYGLVRHAPAVMERIAKDGFVALRQVMAVLDSLGQLWIRKDRCGTERQSWIGWASQVMVPRAVAVLERTG